MGVSLRGALPKASVRTVLALTNDRYWLKADISLEIAQNLSLNVRSLLNVGAYE